MIAVRTEESRRGPADQRLAEVFTASWAELLRVLARVLGSAEDAQDVAQEAFLKCWRHREQVGEVRDLKAWIFRVGLNAAHDLRRSGWTKYARPLGEPGELPTRPAEAPVEAAQHGETLERLRAAVAGLCPEERDVFVLRHQTGLTYARIGELHGLPTGTVKTRMRTALARLRQALAENPRREAILHPEETVAGALPVLRTGLVGKAQRESAG